MKILKSASGKKLTLSKKEWYNVGKKVGWIKTASDVLSFDVPLIIRVMEYAKEDAKTDMDLHVAVENMLRIGKGKTLTMADYDKIVSVKTKNTKKAEKEDKKVSNCCSVADRLQSEDGPSYSDIGICPKCKEHCEFVNEDEDEE